MDELQYKEIIALLKKNCRTLKIVQYLVGITLACS